MTATTVRIQLMAQQLERRRRIAMEADERRAEEVGGAAPRE